MRTIGIARRGQKTEHIPAETGFAELDELTVTSGRASGSASSTTTTSRRSVTSR